MAKGTHSSELVWPELTGEPSGGKYWRQKSNECNQETMHLRVGNQLLHVDILLALQVTTQLQEALQQCFVVRVTPFALGKVLPHLVCLLILEGSSGRTEPLPEGLPLGGAEPIKEGNHICILGLLESLHLLFKAHALLLGQLGQSGWLLQNLDHLFWCHGKSPFQGPVEALLKAKSPCFRNLFSNLSQKASGHTAQTFQKQNQNCDAPHIPLQPHMISCELM